jgi:hypothetical protein
MTRPSRRSRGGVGAGLGAIGPDLPHAGRERPARAACQAGDVVTLLAGPLGDLTAEEDGATEHEDPHRPTLPGSR